MFGQHLDPDKLTGYVGSAYAGLMASTVEVYWTIKGRSSHAATPHLGADPVLASANLIVTLQGMLAKFKNPNTTGILTISSIEGGSACNIIPDIVTLKGTLRSYDMSWRDEFLKKLEEVSANIAGCYGCRCDFRFVLGYPALINDLATTQYLLNLAMDMFGVENAGIIEPFMYAEDFAYYSEKVPSCFWFLGSRSSDEDD